MLCRNGGKYRLTLCQIPSTASGVWKETANMLVEYESRVLPCVEKRLALSELHQWHQTGVYRTHWCRGVGPPGPAGFAPSAAVCLVHLGFTGSYRGRLEGTHGDSWPAGPWVWYLCTKPGQNFHLLLHKKAFFSAKTTSKHGFIDCRKVAPRGAGWSPPPRGLWLGDESCFQLLSLLNIQKTIRLTGASDHGGSQWSHSVHTEDFDTRIDKNFIDP